MKITYPDQKAKPGHVWLIEIWPGGRSQWKQGKSESAQSFDDALKTLTAPNPGKVLVQPYNAVLLLDSWQRTGKWEAR